MNKSTIINIYKYSYLNQLLFLFVGLFSLSVQAQIGIGNSFPAAASPQNVSISADGKTVAFSTHETGVASEVKVYKLIGNNWLPYNNGLNFAPLSFYYVSLSDDGKRLAVGDSEFGSLGRVILFEDISGAWQVIETISGISASTCFGQRVSFSGDGKRLGIGNPCLDIGANTDAGEIKIYEEAAPNWVQVGNTIQGTAFEDKVGEEIKLSEDGKRFIGGSPFHGLSDVGKVFTMEEQNNTWVTYGQPFTTLPTSSYIGVGVTISDDGNTIAYSGTEGLLSGFFEIHNYVGGTWVLAEKRVYSYLVVPYKLSLSADGSRLAFGLPDFSSNGVQTGFLEMLQLSQGVWTAVGDTLIGGANITDFGIGVDLSSDGSTVVVGSVKDFINVTGGNINVFKYSPFGNYITGNVSGDFNFNCMIDSSDLNLANYLVKAQSASYSYYAMTDTDGNYFMDLDTGGYSITLSSYSPFWKPCIAANIVLLNTGDSIELDLPLEPLMLCPYLTVDISTPFLRRCFLNNYIVSYCNQGTVAAPNSYIEVNFDPKLDIISSSIPWTTVTGTTYTFPVGSLGVSDCGQFSVTVIPNCDSTILGQTFCVEATIYPDSICNGSTPIWDGSITEVAVQCETDSITFTIENTGTGDMSTPLEYLVIEDNLITKQAMFQLLSFESMQLKFPANGSTYRLYAEQSLGHFPDNYHPTVAYEGCGLNSNGTYSTGFINLYAENDVLNTESVDCQELIGSFDPNDKNAMPIGYGNEHFIEVNTDLNYRIRFQNTGTDTAFTVIILDTLSTHLDLTSLQLGTSSHNYTLEVVDSNILKFVFNDILLPDSTVNEPESHGFVKFKISQQPNLPLGTMIYNRAAIYFDFNEPIITNETHHEIGENFINIMISTATESTPELEDLSVTVQPNPFVQYAEFMLKNAPEGEKSFELYDGMGRLVTKEEFTNDSMHRFQKENLSEGIYFYRILIDNQLMASGKLIASH